jgi:hypothetical protein
MISSAADKAFSASDRADRPVPTRAADIAFSSCEDPHPPQHGDVKHAGCAPVFAFTEVQTRSCARRPSSFATD